MSFIHLIYKDSCPSAVFDNSYRRVSTATVIASVSYFAISDISLASVALAIVVNA